MEKSILEIRKKDSGYGYDVLMNGDNIGHKLLKIDISMDASERKAVLEYALDEISVDGDFEIISNLNNKST